MLRKHGRRCDLAQLEAVASQGWKAGLRDRLFKSIVIRSAPGFVELYMNDTPKPLSASVIHSVYSGTKITSVVEQAKGFKSTNSFARDASHSGQAPEKPKVEKKRPRQ